MLGGNTKQQNTEYGTFDCIELEILVAWKVRDNVPRTPHTAHSVASRACC